ncbi:helix-turn-helix domain-containing protein [Nocardioides panacisoli]|uniref:TetR/AcrR family transcriptional regulator n=1 Tax=Nocardioides panacisoli TaxID=627624 RepID=UPI0031E0901A
MTKAAAGTRKRRAYAARVPLDVRRQQLLDAALRLISRDGYAGLTVEAIAKEAGVTKPVVYGAYAKLPELLAELLERTQKEAVAQLLAAFPPDASAANEHLARDVTRAWTTTVREHPDTWAPILLTGAHTPEVVLQRIEQSRRVVRDSIAAMFPRKEGSPAGARDLLAAEALVAVAHHFGRRLLLEPESVDDDELARLIEDLVRGALGRS